MTGSEKSPTYEFGSQTIGEGRYVAVMPDGSVLRGNGRQGDKIASVLEWLDLIDNSTQMPNRKLGDMLIHFGGTYRPGHPVNETPSVLEVAGIEVSATGSADNLLATWKAEAQARLA